MSNCALKYLPDLFNLPVEKMVGDLDYSKIRTHLTPLTETEMKYCENDIKVITAYIKEQIENFIKTNVNFSQSEDTILAVKIEQFAASSIDIRLICFTKTAQYLEWMNVKDLLAMEIKSIVEKNKASFAFPSTSIYVEKN